MATSTKKAPARRPAAPRPSPASKPKPPSQPSLRFHISAALRKETLAVLAVVQKAKKPDDHRDALIDTVVSLNDAGTSYYFLRPLELAKGGFAVEQLAKVSMAANQRLVASAIRTVMGRMDDRQLVFVCKYIRQLML